MIECKSWMAVDWFQNFLITTFTWIGKLCGKPIRWGAGQKTEDIQMETAGYQQSVNWLADWKQSDATWSSNRKWRALKQRAKAKITRKNNVHDYKTIMKPGTRSSNSTILIMHFVATSLNLSHRPRSGLTTTCILIKQSYYEDWCKWYGIVAMSLFAREGTNVVIINGPQARIILSTSASPAGYPPWDRRADIHIEPRLFSLHSVCLFSVVNSSTENLNLNVPIRMRSSW